MLELIALAAQVALIALIAYNLVTAMWGWANPRPAAAGSRARRFRIVVPAHDEEAVIGSVLDDIARLDYPADLIAAWVLADRCTDGTAAVAAGRARVDERTQGPDGKGALLRWHLDRYPLDDGEALVVADADNRLPPELLGRFADELDAGRHTLQAYLDVANPDASPLATASAVSYWASNRMVQLARRNLGWSADLGGTGMCLTGPALAAAGGFGDSLTEDADLGVRLALSGTAVTWLHDVRVMDEKPASVGAAVGQRARWMAGRRGVARRHVPALLRRAVTGPSLAMLDHAVRLVQPGRSFVALVSGVLAVAAAVWPGGALLPWPVWAIVTAVQFLAPIAFLARDRVPARYLVRYPMLAVLAALWLPVRIASRTAGRWYHTPHQGS